ncbi:MAG: hypothetical protein WCJ09_26955 [Planctomycetota bacterium]
MREFFRGWRRKAGCVTLLMAIAVTGAWIRSRVIHDFLTIRSRKTLDRLSATSQGMKWERVKAIRAADFPKTVGTEWTSFPASTTMTLMPFDSVVGIYSVNTIQSDWQFCGFRSQRGHYGEATFVQHGYWVIPYWSFAAPLTLLSACLILWKPQK